MRDLKADLKFCDRVTQGPWRQSTSLEETWDIGEAWECFCREKAELWEELWLDQALAEKERADKAEALVRELADMLGRVTPLELDLELVREAYGLLKKAKEVLGDE